MQKACQIELQSSGWLQKNTSDRPSFEVTIHRLVTGPRGFQVFALPTGLLFLELRDKPGEGEAPKGAVVAGAVLGGAIGALVGGMIASSMSGPPDREHGFDMCSEEQLFELAAQRKRSFVATNAEIQSISIEASSGGLFGNKKRTGWIILRDSSLGRVKMTVRDPFAMSVAVDALPRRFGERVQVNVELHPQTMQYVPRKLLAAR